MSEMAGKRKNAGITATYRAQAQQRAAARYGSPFTKAGAATQGAWPLFSPSLNGRSVKREVNSEPSFDN